MAFRHYRHWRNKLLKRLGNGEMLFLKFLVRLLTALLNVNVAAAPQGIGLVELTINEDRLSLQAVQLVSQLNRSHRCRYQVLIGMDRALQPERRQNGDGLQQFHLFFGKGYLRLDRRMRLQERMTERMSA